MVVAHLLVAAALAGGATHDGEATAANIHWRSNYVVEDRSLPLALPLPAGTRVVGAKAVSDSEGRVVALKFDGIGNRRVETIVPSRADHVLVPPLAATRDAQRVVLSGGFVPEKSHGFVKHIRYWIDPDLTGDDRRYLNIVGGKAKISDQALYVIADGDLVSAGGIRGGAAGASVATRNRNAFLGVASMFALLLLLFGGIYRALETVAKREKNDEYIRAHLGEEPQTAE